VTGEKRRGGTAIEADQDVHRAVGIVLGTCRRRGHNKRCHQETSGLEGIVSKRTRPQLAHSVECCDRRSWANSGHDGEAVDWSARETPCYGPYCAQTGMRLARVSAYPRVRVLPIAIEVDVHYVSEASMRLVACLALCLFLILANTAQTGAQAPSAPQGYCVNSSADFYPYTGELCKSGYQLGSGNCRRTDGRMVAVPREECLAQAGTVELPFEGGRLPTPPPAPRR
jgi:hypothetical protein